MDYDFLAHLHYKEDEDFVMSDYLAQQNYDEDAFPSFPGDAQRDYEMFQRDSEIRTGSEAANNEQGAARSSRAPQKPPKIEKARIEQYLGRNSDDAAKELGVSKSTLKRYCRFYGIERWPSHKRSSNKYTVSVKATYRTTQVFFYIDNDTEIEQLWRNLGDEFRLQVGSFRIEYEDDDGSWIMISRTKELKEHMDELRSSGKNFMDLLVTQWNS